MGFSVRVANARYTEWRSWVGAKLAGDWSAAGLRAIELYDHENDNGVGPAAFDAFENVNLAYLPASQGQVAQLHAVLKAHFTTDASADAILLAEGMQL